MTHLFRDESSHALTNAQRNLSGRTHYVDTETLRWHESRVLSARVHDNGLLFSIITRDSIDPPHSWTGKTPRKGYRFVIFDVFGTVLQRPNLEESYGTKHKAEKAMYAALNEIDAPAHTLQAIEQARKSYDSELNQLVNTVESLKQKAA